MSTRQRAAPNGNDQDGPPPLTATGVRGLDEVLGGGLPRGSLVIVMGPPGSGKTTLANEMGFAAVRAGNRALVLTALSESTSKLIAHLRAFSFFDDELIGDALQFLSLQQFLAEGLEAGGDGLIAMARRARADLVVLDGFRGVKGVDLDPHAARQFLYDVGSTLSVLGKSTIVTSEADPRDPLFFPEATTADVIVGLHYGLVGVRQSRTLEVIKMRGAAPLPGLHGLALDRDGVAVYPRLEARVSHGLSGRDDARTPPNVAAPPSTTNPSMLSDQRAPTGLPELDRLLGGGLTRRTSTLVVGNMGTGKTLLALHFALAGVRAGEPTVFMSFRESPDELMLKASQFAHGADLQKALAAPGGITLVWHAPVELNPDSVGHELLDALSRSRAKRLVVDSMAELERAVAANGDPDRVHGFLAALLEALRVRGVTTLCIKEIRQAVGVEPQFADEPVAVMAGNVLLLEQVEQQAKLRRVLSVLKMRFSAHDATLHEFVIAPPEGIRVLGPYDGGPGALTGIAQQLPDQATRRPDDL